VITSVTEISKVQPGEILVCGGTTTEWTPVFGIIKACVCDTGGSLTHAAIVSREYGIERVRTCLEYRDAERLEISTDCGLRRVPRYLAIKQDVSRRLRATG
jgi:pyruvate,water dikinase